MLIVGSILILSIAIPRLFAPEPVVPEGMLALAILGILANGFAVLKTRHGKTMNEKVVSWHLMEDMLGWVAVLIISVAMLIGDFPILDPLFSVIFTAYILWNVLKSLKQTLMLFLQSIPEGIELESIKNEICTNPLVEDMHDTHVWSLDGAYHILTTHIVVSTSTTKDQIVQLKQKVREVIHHSNIQHATLEIEQEGEVCHLKEC